MVKPATKWRGDPVADLLKAKNSISSNSCKGQIFRADVQMCMTKRGVMFSVRLNKLKRMSCPGCEYCSWITDDLSEIDPDHWPIIGIESAEHGKLYTLEMCNVGRDYETGMVDEWDLRVVECTAKGEK